MNCRVLYRYSQLNNYGRAFDKLKTELVEGKLPLSWWFLSGCTGRGLDTRLGLLLTLLALTEFIWGVGNLEENVEAFTAEEATPSTPSYFCLLSI